MALMIDNNWAGIEVLAAEDGGALVLSQVEGVDLSAKMALAAERVQREISRFLARNSGVEPSQVVMQPSILRWHRLAALAAAYQEGYFHQLNDRHKEKWKQYELLAVEARSQVFEEGVRYVNRPVRAPGPPVVEAAAGSLAAGGYWFAATLTTADGMESAPGEPLAYTSIYPQGVAVSLATVDRGDHRWNLYAGTSLEGMCRQNPAPVPPGEACILAHALEISGPKPGSGQDWDGTVNEIHRLRRG